MEDDFHAKKTFVAASHAICLHFQLFLIIFVCPKCKQIGCNVAANGFLACKSSSLLVNFRQLLAKQKWQMAIKEE